MAIVIQNTVFKVYDGSTQVVLTALVNGLTPARLLLAASALVLFLAAYVSRG